MKKISFITGMLFLIVLPFALLAQEPEPSTGTTRNIVPREPSEGSIGTENKPWASGWFSELHVGGSTVPTVAWTPSGRVITEPTGTVLVTDYLIWMDTEAAGMTQTLELPDMVGVDSMCIVIRKLGGDHEVKLKRVSGSTTNYFTLAGDGASIAVDWLGGSRSQWFWRQAY